LAFGINAISSRNWSFLSAGGRFRSRRASARLRGSTAQVFEITYSLCFICLNYGSWRKLRIFGKRFLQLFSIALDDKFYS
jgi:hypothetical protein